MTTKLTRAALAQCAAGLLLVAVAGSSQAAPEEIQVYMNEMNMPGTFGLDVHHNYVVSGAAGVNYPGAQPARHTLRITPEFSYGWTPNLELGAYLLSSRDPDGQLRTDGAKLRLKFIAPTFQNSPFFYGANLELGRVSYRLDENPWNGELKGIFGYQSARWKAAVNANVDFKVSGPISSPATLELAGKLAYRTDSDCMVGVESYNAMGELRRLGPQTRTVYAVLDTAVRGWDLNLGVGRGNGAASDRWVIKMIVGVPLGN
ncbi:MULTISPECIES: hypothetical protein [Duganella]|uniref:hypothetical protein n=1 Tax=Duganella TaxID=75654 RepID=UPI0030E764AE